MKRKCKQDVSTLSTTLTINTLANTIAQFHSEPFYNLAMFCVIESKLEFKDLEHINTLIVNLMGLSMF